MTEPFEEVSKNIIPYPTNIYGLRFFPSLEPYCSNDRDGHDWPFYGVGEVSDCNRFVIESVLARLGDKCQAIMEIGVNRNQHDSITQVFLNKRPASCLYLGVDIEDKSYLNDSEIGIHTICCSSHAQLSVREKLSSMGVDKLDVLMIDGWHSVNTCVNDWRYADLLSDHGVVVLHDTNAHPGCVALFNAVNEDLFEKHRLCTERDHGIAVFWKKPIDLISTFGI